jgi:hypothetical protein
MVEKVFFSQEESGNEPRAVGVEISANLTAQKYRVATHPDAIGYGAASELEAQSITVVKDLLAVGKNLSDVGVFVSKRLY